MRQYTYLAQMSQIAREYGNTTDLVRYFASHAPFDSSDMRRLRFSRGMLGDLYGNKMRDNGKQRVVDHLDEAVAINSVMGRNYDLDQILAIWWHDAEEDFPEIIDEGIIRKFASPGAAYVAGLMTRDLASDNDVYYVEVGSDIRGVRGKVCDRGSNYLTLHELGRARQEKTNRETITWIVPLVFQYRLQHWPPARALIQAAHFTREQLHQPLRRAFALAP